MTELLITLALWGALILFIMRSRDHAAAPTWQAPAPTGDPGPSDFGMRLSGRPPERATDPVSGKTVRTERAKPSVHERRVYYFCSRDCREIFEAAPELYLDGGDANGQPMEPSHA